MTDDTVETYDVSCKHCGAYSTFCRPCDQIGCDDGVIDNYEEDPFWYDPGDMSLCEECNGTGLIAWCPECGKDPRTFEVGGETLLLFSDDAENTPEAVHDSD